jgi:hypothetical protein
MSKSTSPLAAASEEDSSRGVGLARPPSASVSPPPTSFLFKKEAGLATSASALAQISEATLNAIRRAVEAHQAGLAAC